MPISAKSETAEIAARAAHAVVEIEREELPANLYDLLMRSVTQFRSRPLWVSTDGGPGFNFASFAAETDRYAAVFASLGVRRGTTVASMLPNVAAAMLTWMALAKLGAVLVPVNTQYTAAELDIILRTSEARLLVMAESFLGLLDALPPLAGLCVVTHGEAAQAGRLRFEDLLEDAGSGSVDPQTIAPDDLMTLQFTSGSTGTPKGCMLSHRYWMQIGLVRARQGPPVTRMLIDMPFHYMGGQWRFLMALYLGATAFVAHRPTLTRMIDRLIDHQIEFCSVSPLLAKYAADSRASQLKLAWAGTMAMSPELHAELESRLGGAPVREMYGLTETGAVLAMPIDAPGMTGSGSCGLPVPFRECRIVDGAGVDLPAGNVGELWVSGPGMMLGYFNRPDATAEAFEGPWFKTGDLVMRDEAGFYRIVGRIKDVIRRSGENISATEVEHVLTGMPEIVEAAAVGVPDEFRGQEVKAFVVLGRKIEPDVIIARCRMRLAPFKIPRFLTFVDELPRTPSGKIAKFGLLAADARSVYPTFDVVAGAWQ